MKTGIITLIYRSLDRVYGMVEGDFGWAPFKILDGVSTNDHGLFEATKCTWSFQHVYSVKPGQWLRADKNEIELRQKRAKRLREQSAHEAHMMSGIAATTITFSTPIIPDFCVFCFKHRDGIADTCFYGAHHEFPETASKKEQPVKIDLNKCFGCGLNKKNPMSATNGCEHVYPGAT